MADDLNVRVARLEERTNSLEDTINERTSSLRTLIDLLSKDIEDTKALLNALRQDVSEKLERMDEKLDTAIDTSRRALPRWAHLVIVVLIGLLSAAITLLTHK